MIKLLLLFCQINTFLQCDFQQQYGIATSNTNIIFLQEVVMIKIMQIYHNSPEHNQIFSITQSIPYKLKFSISLKSQSLYFIQTIQSTALDPHQMKNNQQSQEDNQLIKFPIQQNQRQITDPFCTAIATILVLLMLILASLVWNQDKLLYIATSLTSQQYQQCQFAQFTYLSNFPHLHVFYTSSIKPYKCLKKCPSIQQIQQNNQQTQLNNLPICIISRQDFKHYYWKNKIFSIIENNQGFIQTIVYVLIIGIGWGMLKMAITQSFPRHMAIFSYVLAVGLLLVYAFFVFGTQVTAKLLGKWNLWLGVSLIILALILTVMMCVYPRQLKFQGYMLQYAVTYLNHNPATFIAIPLFFFLHLCLTLLLFWQHLCFSSDLVKNIVVWKLTLSQILDVITLIEYLWGLRFLRDAFNFCVSGNAVDWYWTKKVNCSQSYQRLICKHWGSVVAGSFLNCFFSIPALISQLFVCHPGTCCSKLGSFCHNQLSVIGCFFDRVRTDVYSYINISGLQYCESAEQCSYLCDKSNLFVGYHSAMKHHKLSSHIGTVFDMSGSICFVFLLGYWIMTLKSGHQDWFLHTIILIFVIYSTVVWFNGIHADIAEALQTCYLAQFQIQGDYKYMQHLLPVIIFQFVSLQERYCNRFKIEFKAMGIVDIDIERERNC